MLPPASKSILQRGTAGLQRYSKSTLSVSFYSGAHTFVIWYRKPLIVVYDPHRLFRLCVADALSRNGGVWRNGAGRQAGHGCQFRLGRSQNQLHIHLTCLREDVYRQLQAERPYIQDDWHPLPDKLLTHTYYARRVLQPSVMGIYPVASVARDFHLSPPQLAEYGIAVVPATFSGKNGFILLVTRRGWDKGNRASVESLLDKNCEILHDPTLLPPQASPVATMKTVPHQ